MGEAFIIVAEVVVPRKAAAEAAHGPESFRLRSIAMIPVHTLHSLLVEVVASESCEDFLSVSD